MTITRLWSEIRLGYETKLRLAAEVERLKAELAKAREREEIMCMALTNQIEFEWSDDEGGDPGYGSMVVEYPYGAEVRTFEGRWDDCLDAAAREGEKQALALAKEKLR